MPNLNVAIATRLGREGFPLIYDLQICLAAQRDKNFTWLILLRPSAHRFEKILKSELEQTEDLWSRTKIIKCSTDNRSKLLNIALRNVSTGYINIFDDDDLPFSNFIETIRNEARNMNGMSIIRTQTFQIETESNLVQGRAYNIAMSNGNNLWPEAFQRLSHLDRNLTPCMAVSYPIKLVKKFHLTWDETLDAVEDWDFLIRSSDVIEVKSTNVVTSIYRRADKEYRSKKLLSNKAWKESENKVRAKIARQLFVLEGDQILSLRNSRVVNVFAHWPLRAHMLFSLMRFFEPRLINYPNLYVTGKIIHKYLKRILKIEEYV